MSAIVAAGGGFPAIDPSAAAIVASVLVFVGGIYNVSRADRRARDETASAPTPAPSVVAPTPTLTGDIDFVKYVRGEVDKAVELATRQLRTDLDELRGQFRGLRTVLRHTREAFREYIREWRAYERQVRETWGATGAPPTPPVLTARIRDLLAEDDLDGTFSAAEVAEHVEESRAAERSTAPQPPSSTEWG